MELEQSFKKTLSREKEFISCVLNFSYSGIAVLDEKGGFQVYNPGMERIFGYNATEIPDFEMWLKSVFPKATLRAQVRAAFWADVKSDSLASPPGEKGFPFIYGIRRKGGSGLIYR